MKARILGLRLVALAAMLSATGCAQAGALGEILGGVMGPQGQGQQGQGQGGQVVGEIQGIDARQGVMQIRTQNGQTGNVRFDQNTRVVYQQREYAVTALERGDVVAFQVQQDQRGNAYTNYIQVQQSVQDRSGQNTQQGGSYGNNAVQRFVGTVGYIDTQRGAFELRTQNGSAQVALPYGASAQDAQRFRSLRSGQSVTLDGQMVAQGRIDLVRFIY
jgi:cold shock CspA family protein